MCVGVYFVVAGCTTAPSSLYFHFHHLLHAHITLELIHFAPSLNLLDFSRFLGPKRVGVGDKSLLATADVWIQESRSLAEVCRLGFGKNPRKR